MIETIMLIIIMESQSKAIRFRLLRYHPVSDYPVRPVVSLLQMMWSGGNAMESNDTSSTSRRDLGVAAGGKKGVH